MKKIKTALLSYGMSGKVFHAPFLNLHEGFELVGAWERSNKHIQEDYLDVKSFDSLKAVLAEDVELIVVNTPIDTHFEYAKKALQAGKHIVVEKSFTTTAKEALELKTLADKKGLKLAVFQNRRWDSDFKTVKQIVNSNILGEIVEAEIRFDRYNPMLSDKKWKELPTAGSGILFDLGPHIIDQAIHLFGFPQAVFADIRKLREQSEIDDNIDITLFYTDKRVRLHAGYFNKELQPAYIFQGRNGSLFKQRGDIQEDTLKTGVKPNLNSWGTEPKTLEGLLHAVENGETIRKRVPTLQGNYYDFYDAMFTAIRKGKPEPVTANDGLMIMQVIDAAILSSKKGIVVQL